MDDDEDEDEAPRYEGGGQPSAEVWKPCKACGAETWKLEGHCLACGAEINPPSEGAELGDAGKKDEVASYASCEDRQSWWKIHSWS